MEASAPEKIYLQHIEDSRLWPAWFTAKMLKDDIEYIRTDAFIEKAAEWLTENVEKHISADGEYTIYYEEMFEDFRKYMIGD